MNIKVGFGFDVHQLKEERPFFLGGILVPYTKGGFGHSDADVLIHAICYALLGAANLGDIGKHFPDTSAEFKSIDSKILLKEVIRLIRSKGYELGNIDSTICLQKPKISKYILQMREALASCMQVDIDLVSVKATTTEQLGFVGREEGVSAYATVLIKVV